MPRIPSSLTATLLAAAITACSGSAASDAPAAPDADMNMPGEDATMATLITDVRAAQEKILALAGAVPESAYDWRPGEGVRSIREVYQHIEADNYFLPVLQGVPAPEATGITSDYRGTVVPYERREATRDEILAELETSFAHLIAAMEAQDPATLGEGIQAFGQDFTRRSLWVNTATHLHEHLGQSIAYARTNGVVPPWSR